MGPVSSELGEAIRLMRLVLGDALAIVALDPASCHRPRLLAELGSATEVEFQPAQKQLVETAAESRPSIIL
jgi:hypothetical protein